MTTSSTSINVFVDLIDAALAADLGKNEMKAFLTLLRQTLGFRKSSDHLTDHRLVTLSGVRKDRLKAAIDSVVSLGLFERESSAEYQNRYSVGSDFLTANDGVIFSPAIPKNGETLRKTEDLPEKQKAFICNNNTNPNNLKPQHTPAESVAKPKPVCGGDVDPVIEQHIPKNNQQACQTALSELADKQPVLTVFGSMVKAGKAKKPTGLLIALCKKALQGTLIMPESETLPTSSHASHQVFKRELDDGELERRSKLGWMKEQAKLMGKSIDEIAKIFNMSELLGEEVAYGAAY